MNARPWTALLLAGLWACRDSGPSSPTAFEGTANGTGAGTAAPPESGAVAGRVVDALTGAPVAAARVTVAERDAISAQPDGVFRVEGIALSDVAVVVEAPGYWKRETRMRPVDGGTAVELDLLPDGREFDLGFFDHVFRNVGESGTHPWTEEPVFEIWENVYECTRFVDGRACEEITALDEPAPGTFLQRAREVIRADATQYTNGEILGANVSTVSHAPGTVLSRDGFIERGKVAFVFVVRPDDFSWSYWRWRGDGSMVGGHVHMNRRHRDRRGIYSHELAHTLGFNHPLGLDRVPLNSIMRRGHGDVPTRVDLVHGRILYRRPPDSRTPDVDPPDYSLNGLRLASTAPFAEVTESAP